MNLRALRLNRGWSQEQLANASGLSVRTIQRIENGGQPGLASGAALRNVFGADVDQDAIPKTSAEISAEIPAGISAGAAPMSFVDAIRTCLAKYAELHGRAGRAEYWWFFLFVGLIASGATLLADVLGGLVLLALAFPLIAAGARRLRDAGQSPWWQLLALVPFGAVVPLIMLTFPSSPLPDGPGDLGEFRDGGAGRPRHGSRT
jgi:transcriptional regulator with XRE-family HTH domain